MSWKSCSHRSVIRSSPASAGRKRALFSSSRNWISSWSSAPLRIRSEVVVNELEVLLPQERHQIVARFRREETGFVQQLEELDQLVVLGTLADREHPHPVLVEHPGQAFGLVDLAVDDVLFPAQLGLAHVEHQLVDAVPDRAERGFHVLRGALVNRIV